MNDKSLLACTCGCVVIDKHPNPNTADHLLYNTQFGCVLCGMTAPCGETIEKAKENWNKLITIIHKELENANS